MRSAIVRDHSAQFRAPLKATKHQVLRVGHRDDEWPGWLWCTAADGAAGWVPEALLDLRGPDGILTRDYETTELAVAVGDQVDVHEELAGWAWVTNEQNKSGWIPVRCLAGRGPSSAGASR